MTRAGATAGHILCFSFCQGLGGRVGRIEVGSGCREPPGRGQLAGSEEKHRGRHMVTCSSLWRKDQKMLSWQQAGGRKGTMAAPTQQHRVPEKTVVLSEVLCGFGSVGTVVQIRSRVPRLYCGLEPFAGSFGLNSALQRSRVKRQRIDLNCLLAPTEIQKWQ